MIQKNEFTISCLFHAEPYCYLLPNKLFLRWWICWNIAISSQQHSPESLDLLGFVLLVFSFTGLLLLLLLLLLAFISVYDDYVESFYFTDAVIYELESLLLIIVCYCYETYDACRILLSSNFFAKILNTSLTLVSCSALVSTYSMSLSSQ